MSAIGRIVVDLGAATDACGAATDAGVAASGATTDAAGVATDAERAASGDATDASCCADGGANETATDAGADEVTFVVARRRFFASRASRCALYVASRAAISSSTSSASVSDALALSPATDAVRAIG
jgi:hypothetical protein